MQQYLNVVRLSGKLGVTTIDTDTSIITRDKVDYEPTLYVRSNVPSKLTNIHGEYVETKRFNCISDADKYKRECASLDIGVYGMDNFVCQYMNDTEFEANAASNVRIFFIDIENKMTDKNGDRFGIDPIGAKGEMTAITLHDSYDDTYHIFACVDWTPSHYNKHLKTELHHSLCEREMLKEFLAFWIANYPDIVSGWNSEFYDIPYLVNRLAIVLGKTNSDKLSPWGKISNRATKDKFNNETTVYTIHGVSHLDYILVYKKNTFSSRESYSLDFIANYELDVGKIDYVSDGYKNLDDLYERNPQAYVDYNIRDVESLVNIDKKHRFMSLVISIAYYSKVNFDEVYSVIRCWDSIIHSHLQSIGVVTSPKVHSDFSGSYMGAYVMDPVIGLHANVVSFDLNSLYPSIIRTLNLGFETKKYSQEKSVVEDIIAESIDTSYLVENNLTLAANGTVYDNREQSTLSFLMERLYGERSADKRHMLKLKTHRETLDHEDKELDYEIQEYSNREKVKKTLLNSAYGGLGNKHFRYFDIDNAEAITYTGQLALKWISDRLNTYLNMKMSTDAEYIIYGDTDSIYLNLSPIVDKLKNKPVGTKLVEFLDKVSVDIIEPFIAKSYKELGEIINTKDNQLVMARENIADYGLWKKKKMYALRVWDSEGVRYSEDHLYYKIMGLEIVRSSTPKLIRGYLKECMTKMLSGVENDVIIEYIDETLDTLRNIQNVADISVTSSVNNIEHYSDAATLYKSGTPIAVRAAILSNYHYEAGIRSGDKIKYTYLKLPNPINENIIGYTENIPENLREYIDYKTNIFKAFLKPLTSMMEVADMTVEKTNTLF